MSSQVLSYYFPLNHYRGIVGFYVAQAVGDDIYLYDDEAECHSNGTNPKAILHGLRQQAEVDTQLHYQVGPIYTERVYNLPFLDRYLCLYLFLVHVRLCPTKKLRKTRLCRDVCRLGWIWLPRTVSPGIVTISPDY